MKISPILPSDIESVMCVERECHEFPWSEKTLSTSLTGRYFSGALDLNHGDIGAFYIAEQAGPDITLMDICVAPQYQGLGYSKLLMKELIQQARTRSAENIFLEVRAGNTPAINLYKAFNFCEVGIRKNYYPAKDGKEDAILMACALI